MKMRKLQIGMLGVGLLLGFSSCLDDKGNSIEQVNSPAVVASFNSGRPYIATSDMAFYPKDEASLPDLEQGDCGLVHYYVDFDNQPSNTYYTAEVRGWIPVNSYNYTYSNELENENYKDTLSYPPGVRAIIERKVFLETSQIKSKDEALDFRWLYGPEISYEEEGKATMYLQFSKTQANNAAYSFNDVNAFSLPPDIFRDTILRPAGTNYEHRYKYAFLDIKYPHKYDENGEPVFISLRSNPYEVWELIDVSY